MGGSEEETVTRDESTSDPAEVVDDTGDPSDSQSEDPRIEPLERWFDSIERDFDGSQTQKLRGLGKYAVTWLVALSAVGVLFGLILHVLVTLLPFTLFGSLVGNVGRTVGFVLAVWPVAVGGKLNDLFG